MKNVKFQMSYPEGHRHFQLQISYKKKRPLGIGDLTFEIRDSRQWRVGFTILELLIVMSVVTIIGLTSVPFLSRFYTQNAVSNTYDQLTGELRKAQTYAMIGKQNGPWGVYLNTVSKKIILYQ